MGLKLFFIKNQVKIKRLCIINCLVKDLEVDDEPRTPIKKMRYPVEDGELYQNRIRQRRERLMEFLGCSYDEAEDIAENEFAHLMATSSDLVAEEDPGNSKFILGQHNCTNDNFIQESIRFYQGCDSALVKEIPMKTFQKMSYGTGVNLDLIKKSEKPEAKDFWTVNTNRLTNIASQLNMKGCYSQEDEFLEQQKEKAMFKCAHEYGVMANIQIETYDFLEKAVRTNHSSKLPQDDNKSTNTMVHTEELVMGSDVASTTHDKSRKLKIKLK